MAYLFKIEDVRAQVISKLQTKELKVSDNIVRGVEEGPSAITVK